jgi:hypothetical protein
MKHIRKFESYRTKKHRDEIIRESVLQVNDIYKVKTMIDIPQSLINAYIKKVRDTTGKNLRQFFGDVDLAEEIVKYITLNNLDVDKIPGGALMGGQTQGQGQSQGPAQGQEDPMAQTQPAQGQMQSQPQGQAQGSPVAQGQPQVQVQAEGGQNVGDFEEPQAHPQGQAQGSPAAQSQPAQGQTQRQSEEEEEENPENEEELPL